MEDTSFEVVALDDYKAELASELTLVRGEVYTILQMDENRWWYAANRDGETGWVPSNFVERTETAEEEIVEEEEEEVEAPPVPADPVPAQTAVEEEPEEQVEPEAAPEPVQKIQSQIKKITTETRKAPSQQKLMDVSEQSLEELLSFVESNIGPQKDTFNMQRALRMIAYKINKDAEYRKKLVELGGFDTIVSVMEQSLSDIAVQMTCLQTIAIVTIDKKLEPLLQSSKSNPIGAIHKSVGIIDHYNQHNILAFNATCNVATLEVFRERARGVDIVNTIVERVLGSKDKAGFYTSCALALRNLLVDPVLRQNVNGNLITLVTDIISNGSEARTRTAGCGILVNIAQDERLAKEIIDGGGFERLQEIISNPNLEESVKKTAVQVMHNLCITASKLDLDTVAVITFLSSVLEMESMELRALSLRSLSAYAATCKETHLLLRTLVDTGALVEALNVGLQMDSEENKKIALNTICYLGQGKENSVLLAPRADILSKMCEVAPKMTEDVVRNILVLFYHVSENPEAQTTLLDSGLLNILDLATQAATIQALLGILYRCLQNSANSDVVLENQMAIKRFLGRVPDQEQSQQLKNAISQLLERLVVNDATAKKMARMNQGGSTSQIATPPVNTKSSASKSWKKAESKPAATKAVATKSTTTSTTKATTSKKNTTATTPSKKVTKVTKKAAPKVAKEEVVESAEPEDGKEYIPWEYLRSKDFSKYPHIEIDRKNLQSYLSPEEFQQAFNMSREKFSKLKGWKKVQLKKRAKVF